MDIYFKKEIAYTFSGWKYSFAIANNLFSSFDLDHGTDILLRALISNKPKTILDIGCGYGPIGIVLAKKNPQAKVTMVDKDLLAIRYATLNMEKNGITNAVAIGSVGLEQVKDHKFDLIVSNVPAKIGDEAIIQDFILDPISHLTENGEYWIVIVSSLNRLIPGVARKHNLKMKEIRRRNGHTVYRIVR